MTNEKCKIERTLKEPSRVTEKEMLFTPNMYTSSTFHDCN
jgi:hypothetical protein